jgi:hypothetical protein
MAAAALPLAVGLMGAGTLLQAQGIRQQGKAAQQAAAFNATVARQRAEATRSQGRADLVTLDRDARRKIGSARAAYGASGVTMEGSALDVLAQSAWSAELDKQNLLYKTELRALGYEQTGDLEDARGANALSSSRLGAASTLLMGAGKIAGMSAMAGPSTQSGLPAGWDHPTGGFE